VLETFVMKTRDKKAALKFLKKTLKRHGRSDEVVTDLLRSYGAALRELDIGDWQETGRWENNPAENSHQPCRRRERAVLRFRRMRTLEKFALDQAPVLNPFNQERSLSRRVARSLSRIRHSPATLTETSSHSSGSALAAAPEA